MLGFIFQLHPFILQLLARRILKPGTTKGSEPARAGVNSPSGGQTAVRCELNQFGSIFLRFFVQGTSRNAGERRVVNSYYCGYCFNNERMLRRQRKKNGEVRQVSW